MDSLIEKLKKLLFSQPETPETAVFTDELISKLMHDLQNTAESMYSCSESSAMLDEYVEMVNNREDAARLMPLVKAHLDACPGCNQTYNILLAILEGEVQE